MSVRKSLKRHRGWLAVGAIVVAGTAVFIITRQAEPAVSGPSYTTEATTMGTLSVTVDGTGYLAVRDEVEAESSVDGEIARLEVEEGDTVSKGEVLYVLDDSSVRQQIANAKTARSQASQSLSRAELELLQANSSLTKLRSQSRMPSSTVTASEVTIASKQVAIAEDAVSSAEAAYDSAAAAYSDAVAELNDLEVVAPCAGVVWSVNAAAGDAVSSGSAGSSAGSATSAGTSAATSGGSSSSSNAPVTIARDGLLGVELSINEVDVTALKPGQDAEVQFDAVTDLKMTGTVDEVAKTGTASSGVVTYSVWLTLDARDPRLKPGMSASATVVTQVARNVLLVPNSAVKSSDDGSSYVEVLAPGETVPQQTPVEIGIASATQTVIKSGLEEGALVVTKTVTSATTTDESSSGDDTRQGAGIMMMGGGLPGGGPGGQ